MMQKDCKEVFLFCFVLFLAERQPKGNKDAAFYEVQKADENV
jgi:hypothetical protein